MAIRRGSGSAVVFADTIRRARLPAHLGRRADIRGTLERWLGARDLRRYGLPADAIVLVRGMRISWAQVAGSAESRHDDTLRSLLSSASRPALDPFAMATAAVWFADDAELLACMARDMLAGLLSEHWWWRTLLRGDADRAAAIRHWLDSPRSAPRAVEQLRAMGVGAAWFEGWDTSACHALLAGLACHYPLPLAVRNFVETGQTETTVTPRQTPLTSPTNATSRDQQEKYCDVRAWPTLPHSAPERLHRLCLDLARDPACAVDSHYIERQLLATNGDVVPIGAATLPPQPVPAIAVLGPNLSVAARPAAAVDVPSRATDFVGDRLAMSTSQAAPSRAHSEAKTLGIQPHDAKSAACEIQPGATTAHGTTRSDVSPTSFENVTTIDTEHGGLFFVLNAALQLGLYGDFTQPLHRGLAMSPWGFLYHVGREFAQRRFSRDPLAAWLKQESRSDAEPSPCDVDTPWRIERAWLRPFHGDSRPLRAVFQAGHLSLRHRAGFAIYEVHATAAQCEWLIAEQIAALNLGSNNLVRVAASLRDPRPETLPAYTALSRVLPYLRARLALALGLRDGRQLAGLLLRMPARVRAGAERVEVFFELQRLPLPVRLAGLDRDPGWVPAAGRDLRFFFE